MKNVQTELTAITAALASLAKQVERLATTVEKGTAVAAPVKKAKAPAKKEKPKAKQTQRALKKRAVKKAAPKKEKANASAAPKGQSMLDTIFGMVSRSRKGITVAQLKKRTGLENRQVSNALYKLSTRGKIETIARGVYIKKTK